MNTKKNQYLIAMFLFLLLFPAVSSMAQKDEEELPQVEMVGGYSLLRSEGENFHGWKAAVGFTVNRWLAIAVDGDGHYYSTSTSLGKFKQSEHSLTAGPHFSYRNKSKIVPFAYGMAGASWEKSSFAGESESETGFAFETGGGLDWEVSKVVSVRLIDVGASVTHIGGNTTTKPKFMTGLVFKFGRR
jgi:opacity protein-like surface antigen